MAIAKNKLIEKANEDYEYLTGDEATRKLLNQFSIYMLIQLNKKFKKSNKIQTFV